MKEAKFEDLVGQNIQELNGLRKGSREVVLRMVGGKAFRMTHQQDCCESVAVEDVIGDPADLVGTPLTMAEVVSNQEDPEGYVDDHYREGYTWTFYKLATVKGYVTIRWLGESNGYYSEGVDFEEFQS